MTTSRRRNCDGPPLSSSWQQHLGRLDKNPFTEKSEYNPATHQSERDSTGFRTGENCDFSGWRGIDRGGIAQILGRTLREKTDSVLWKSAVIPQICSVRECCPTSFTNSNRRRAQVCAKTAVFPLFYPPLRSGPTRRLWKWLGPSFSALERMSGQPMETA